VLSLPSPSPSVPSSSCNSASSPSFVLLARPSLRRPRSLPRTLSFGLQIRRRRLAAVRPRPHAPRTFRGPFALAPSSVPRAAARCLVSLTSRDLALAALHEHALPRENAQARPRLRALCPRPSSPSLSTPWSRQPLSFRLSCSADLPMSIQLIILKRVPQGPRPTRCVPSLLHSHREPTLNRSLAGRPRTPTRGSS